jgi:hypothetical protein
MFWGFLSRSETAKITILTQVVGCFRLRLESVAPALQTGSCLSAFFVVCVADSFLLTFSIHMRRPETLLSGLFWNILHFQLPIPSPFQLVQRFEESIASIFRNEESASYGCNFVGFNFCWVSTLVQSFRDFRQFLQVNFGTIIRLSHDRFLPSLFPCIVIHMRSNPDSPVVLAVALSLHTVPPGPRWMCRQAFMLC